MKHGPTLLSLLACAGLVCALALPARRGDRPAGSGTAPEATLFAALLTVDALDERQHLIDELRASEPRALARFLEQAVAAADSEPARLAALETLGGCRSGVEIRNLVQLATPNAVTPSSALCAGLRAAVVGTLARDGRAFSGLAAAWSSAGRELRAELLAAVGERGDPAGLEFLAWVATFKGGELDREVAQALVRLAPRARDAESRAALEKLCVLLDSADLARVQSASSALARARVDAAVPTWIALLASESRGMRARARQSLEEFTGLALGDGPERWLAWHESERAWFEDEAPLVLAELESMDDARVLAAVRALAARRLQRDELAQAVAGVLGHASPDVRLYACRALEGLGSVLSVPALVEALADEDEAVARAAGSALHRLTGLDLPLDPAPWRERLARP